ncbi:MAG: hypothetical protein GVY35_02710 [Bacteroidetes bacterium]|jgi:hypothetical protein|nr:hypothetical protein [Bacteroidota bacterium]
MIDLGIGLSLFRGWLRTVEDESVPPTLDCNRLVAQAAADAGIDPVLVPCSPMREEVQRIGRAIIPRLHATAAI